MKKLAKAIRILTVAPIMALLMLLTLYVHNHQLFGSLPNFVLLILFIVIFPLLAYPLQPFIKMYKNKGRDGQRTLAIIFAVAGYICGCFSALILHAPRNVWIIYLSYLLSGILIMLLNKLLHFKASGHACGATGPFVILIYFGEACGYIGIPILALVCFSSIYMKRHTTLQLIGGAAVPVAAFGLALIISLI